MTTSTRSTSYDSDFYVWTQQQAELLRQGRLEDVDLKNLAEEVESLGKRDRRELESRLGRLIQHLLKWQYQPQKRGASGESTIVEQRRRIKRLLQDSPSFQSSLGELLAESYKDGRKDAARDTRMPLDTFPATCSYTWKQLTDEDWLPE